MINRDDLINVIRSKNTGFTVGELDKMETETLEKLVSIVIKMSMNSVIKTNDDKKDPSIIFLDNETVLDLRTIVSIERNHYKNLLIKTRNDHSIVIDTKTDEAYKKIFTDITDRMRSLGMIV